MTREELLQRITSDPNICGGRPCIRGTRIDVAIVLDSMSEGLTAAEIIDHYPHLTVDDIRAACAFGGELARENIWHVAAGS